MTKTISSIIMIGAVAGQALAGDTAFVWNWNEGDSRTSANGGHIESVHARFDSQTDRFTWNVVFGNQITDGYTLAVNDGPNPKGIAGELALLYFDASDNDVVVSAYGYNGRNTQTSYRDGEPQGGDQAPTRIQTTLAESDWVIEATANDTVDGKREFNLTIDASDINGYGLARGLSDWTGIGFDDRIGVWFHPVRNLSSSYNTQGFLSSWNGSQGWLDNSNLSATAVPMPAPVSLAAVGITAVVARRRRA